MGTLKTVIRLETARRELYGAFWEFIKKSRGWGEGLCSISQRSSVGSNLSVMVSANVLEINASVVTKQGFSEANQISGRKQKRDVV